MAPTFVGAACPFCGALEDMTHREQKNEFYVNTLCCGKVADLCGIRMEIFLSSNASGSRFLTPVA
jgi:uncharacterized ferredoxin-like protein